MEKTPEHLPQLPRWTGGANGGAQNFRVACSCGWHSMVTATDRVSLHALGRGRWEGHLPQPGPSTPAGADVATDERRREPIAGVLLAVAAFALIGVIATLVMRDDPVDAQGPAPRGSASSAAAPTPSASATPQDPALDRIEDIEEVEEVEEVDSGETPDEYGLTSADIELLGSMADLYGYGLGPGTSLTFEQATDMAYAMTVPCSDVLVGGMTWGERVAEDVADGAPVADAEGFNAYLRDSFCPLLTDAALQ